MMYMRLRLYNEKWYVMWELQCRLKCDIILLKVALDSAVAAKIVFDTGLHSGLSAALFQMSQGCHGLQPT